jgi:hypothetical protein
MFTEVIIIIKLNCKWVFTRWQWYYNKIQYAKIYISHKIAHHAHTNHSTHSYTNNKGHITHSEYKKRKVIRVTGRGGLWGCEMLKSCGGNYDV